MAESLINSPSDLLLGTDGGLLAADTGCCCECCRPIRKALACDVDGYPYVGFQVKLQGIRPIPGNRCHQDSRVNHCAPDGTYQICGTYHPSISPFVCAWWGQSDVIGIIGCYTPEVGIETEYNCRIDVIIGCWDYTFSSPDTIFIWVLVSGAYYYYPHDYFKYAIEDKASVLAALDTLKNGGTVRIYHSDVIDPETPLNYRQCSPAGSYVELKTTCPPNECEIALPNCSLLEVCIPRDYTLTVAIQGLTNHQFSDVRYNDASGYVPFTDHFDLSNLNGIYRLRLANAGDPFGVSYISTTNPWWFYADLGTLYDIDRPGVKYGYTDWGTSPYRTEMYLYGIYIKVECDIFGTVSITEAAFAEQRLLGDTDGSTRWHWPYAEGFSGSDQSPTSITEFGTPQYFCRSTTMTSHFTDDFMGGDTVNHSFGDDFIITGQIGGWVIA